LNQVEFAVCLHAVLGLLKNDIEKVEDDDEDEEAN